MSWNTLEPHVRTELTNRLTRRQHDILILWLAGCSYDRIAEMLNLSPRTVRTHLHRARTIHSTITNEETR
jgi:DNA-binding CsgD family transcriptional regulator